MWDSVCPILVCVTPAGAGRWWRTAPAGGVRSWVECLQGSGCGGRGLVAWAPSMRVQGSGWRRTAGSRPYLSHFSCARRLPVVQVRAREKELKEER